VGKHRSKERTMEAAAAHPIPTPLLTCKRWFFVGSGYGRCKVRSLLCIVWIGGIGLDAEVDEVQRAGYFLPVWELVDSGMRYHTPHRSTALNDFPDQLMKTV